MPMTPRTPTWAELATEALDGDTDAAFQLAKRAPDTGFEPWLNKWVPADEMCVPVFDVFADAYRRMELERLDNQISKKGT